MAKENDVRFSVSNGKLIARQGRKRVALSYPQAFCLGHALLESGRYQQAQRIFRILSRVRGRRPRAKLMLARCKAEAFKFDACEEILSTVFEGDAGIEGDPGNGESVVKRLQAAFMLDALDAREDAIRELLKVVKQHPDLPTACLFLGDLFRKTGQPKKAITCWRAAIKRDGQGGTITAVARKQLKRMRNALKQPASTKERPVKRWARQAVPQ